LGGFPEQIASDIGISTVGKACDVIIRRRNEY
jgi:hypothetical protein